MSFDGLENQVTELLQKVTAGDRDALEQAYSLLHESLRRIVQSQMSQADQMSLDATMVIDDLWMKITDKPHINWNDRKHFFRTAAQIMRQVLTDQARKRKAAKRGGDRFKASLADVSEPVARDHPDLIELDEALQRLESAHPELATVVELKYFAAFGTDQVAQILELNAGTVRRKWQQAKTLLKFYLTSDEMPPSSA